MREEFLLAGLVTVEHSFEIPLDHDDESGPSITVFAREVADPEGRDRPFLVYFQGGPGSEAPRPHRNPSDPGWLDRALREFRVLMLDQRGTGRSTPVGALPGMSPQEQADYLAHFRADSIVRDSEWIRRELGAERWSLLGQSFGGFCVTTYLSLAPHGLREALLTRRPSTSWQCHRRLLPVHLPAGARAQPPISRAVSQRPRAAPGPEEQGRRRRTAVAVGRPADVAAISPGRRHARHERRRRATALPPRASASNRRRSCTMSRTQPVFRATRSTRSSTRRAWPTAARPDGPRSASCRRSSTRRTCSPESTSSRGCSRTTARSGPCARPPSCSPGASGRGSTTRQVLGANEVPVAAAIYAEDMYVERFFSEQTAAHIRGARPWITNEYEHNGLRADGDRILSRLLDLARGRI